MKETAAQRRGSRKGSLAPFGGEGKAQTESKKKTNEKPASSIAHCPLPFFHTPIHLIVRIEKIIGAV